MIYFVESPDGLRVKIGTTIRLSERLKQLRSQYGAVSVVAVTEGSFTEEAALHARFAAHRLKGEWFVFKSDIHDWIKEHADAWDGTDEVPLPLPDPNLSGVPVDRLIASRLKGVAQYRGMTAAELASDLLRGPTNKAWNDMVRESDKESKTE